MNFPTMVIKHSQIMYSSVYLIINQKDASVRSQKSFQQFLTNESIIRIFRIFSQRILVCSIYCYFLKYHFHNLFLSSFQLYPKLVFLLQLMVIPLSLLIQILRTTFYFLSKLTQFYLKYVKLDFFQVL